MEGWKKHKYLIWGVGAVNNLGLNFFCDCICKFHVLPPPCNQDVWVRLALLLGCRWLVGNYWVKGKEVNEKLLILVAWIIACGSKAVLTAEKVIQCKTGG